jgi:hypothetical protein
MVQLKWREPHRPSMKKTLFSLAISMRDLSSAAFVVTGFSAYVLLINVPSAMFEHSEHTAKNSLLGFQGIPSIFVMECMRRADIYSVHILSSVLIMNGWLINCKAHGIVVDFLVGSIRLHILVLDHGVDELLRALHASRADGHELMHNIMHVASRYGMS